MTSAATVREHTRQKPYAAAKAAMTAKLLAEIEAKVDRQIATAFRTFPVNVWRAVKAGRM